MIKALSIVTSLQHPLFSVTLICTFCDNFLKQMIFCDVVFYFLKQNEINILTLWIKTTDRLSVPHFFFFIILSLKWLFVIFIIAFAWSFYFYATINISLLNKNVQPLCDKMVSWPKSSSHWTVFTSEMNIIWASNVLHIGPQESAGGEGGSHSAKQD